MRIVFASEILQDAMVTDHYLYCNILFEMFFYLRYKKTSAQMMIRWSVQNGFITIPKSSQKDRIIANSQVFDWTIEEEDFNTMGPIKFDLLFTFCPQLLIKNCNCLLADTALLSYLLICAYKILFQANYPTFSCMKSDRTILPWEGLSY